MEYEHKPASHHARSSSGASAAPVAGTAAPFGRSAKTGPVENFRDGGGPERDTTSGADDVDLADDLPI